MTLSPFNLSVPVINLADTRRFYGELLGCAEGRSAECRIDWNFFGHHLVTHVEPADASHRTTDVDSFCVMTPCRHFGVVISQEDWPPSGWRRFQGTAPWRLTVAPWRDVSLPFETGRTTGQS